MNTGDYPEIVALQQAISKHDLRIESMPELPAEAAIFHRRLKLITQQASYIVPVEDEYEDVKNDPGNTALMLHLILSACTDYEEAEDYLVWCKDGGLQPEQPGLRQMHFELREAAPHILEFIGETKPINSWDFCMNTSVAKALRALSNK